MSSRGLWTRCGISSLAPLLACSLTAQEAYTPFGAGCAGTAGVPVLAAAPGSLPRIADDFTMHLSNLPTANSSGFLIFGFSKAHWAGIPLPADLAPFGLSGCTLYASVDSAFPVIAAMGTAEFTVPIPNDPSLLSLEFFNQGLVLDPGANPFLGGAVLTNAAQGTIGPSSFVLTVEILGGTMGTTPQPGIRVLRHDTLTGAVLDEQITDASGVANFGRIPSPRSTITIVDAPTSPGDDGCLVTLADFPSGALTLQGGPEPVSQATFHVSLTGVPIGANVAGVLIGDLESPEAVLSAFVTPPTAIIPGRNVTHLQPDGRFSIVTQAGSSSGITSCGVMLDVDPTTIVSGSTLSIDTSAMPLSVSYTANVPVPPCETNIRRKGLLFGGGFLPGASTTAGSFTFCDIPGADRYSFSFGTDETPTRAELGRSLQFDAPPPSMNVVMPNLNISGLTRNAGTRTLSWTTSGSDLGEIDAVGVEFAWVNFASTSELAWEVFVSGGRSSVTLPALPSDLAIFNPPSVGIDFAVELIGLDNVAGFDALVSEVSGAGGNLDTVLFASGVATFALKSGSN